MRREVDHVSREERRWIASLKGYLVLILHELRYIRGREGVHDLESMLSGKERVHDLESMLSSWEGVCDLESMLGGEEGVRDLESMLNGGEEV